MGKEYEGPGWSRYEVLTVRAPSIMSDMDLGFIIERAIGKFMIEHAPSLRREDITDLVIIKQKSKQRGIVPFEVTVSYFEGRGDQV